LSPTNPSLFVVVFHGERYPAVVHGVRNDMAEMHAGSHWRPLQGVVVADVLLRRQAGHHISNLLNARNARSCRKLILANDHNFGSRRLGGVLALVSHGRLFRWPLHRSLLVADHLRCRSHNRKVPFDANHRASSGEHVLTDDGNGLDSALSVKHLPFVGLAGWWPYGSFGVRHGSKTKLMEEGKKKSFA